MRAAILLTVLLLSIAAPAQARTATTDGMDCKGATVIVLGARCGGTCSGATVIVASDGNCHGADGGDAMSGMPGCTGQTVVVDGEGNCHGGDGGDGGGPGGQGCHGTTVTVGGRGNCHGGEGGDA